VGLPFGGAIPPAAFGEVAFGTVAFVTEGLGPTRGLGAIDFGGLAGFGAVVTGFGAVVAGVGAVPAGFGTVARVVRGLGGAVGPTFGAAAGTTFGTAVGATFVVPVGPVPWIFARAAWYSLALYGLVAFHSGVQPEPPGYLRPR
jgi:hypothetical protein